ncbi:CDP-alcohol phosphatidyltransferase family protein [Candidatus Woesearchaeota archaeon]|nr:CDP-alcohol phosphatidyltransferase family protein [Candidatus Woesearchaeota archaeon]
MVTKIRFTLANSITTIRLVLVPFIIFFILDSNWFAVLALLVIAGITDMLDGWVARITKTQTDFGSVYDSAVDKAFVLSAFIALVIRFDLHIVYLLMILTRDILVTLLVAWFYREMKKKKAVPQANNYGKATTFFQFLTAVLIIFYFDIAVYFIYITSFIGLFAAGSYYFGYKKKYG